MKKLTIISLLLLVIVLNNFKLRAEGTAGTVEISKDIYYDKTLACIVGEIGGLLSGFEFVKLNGNPYVGMPDEWFSIGKGPYGGGPKNGSAGNNCVIANGQIRQDDDYHIDIFNQLVFDQSVNLPTSLDIQRLWKLHQVRDWGGGSKALQLMNNYDYVPPFTGQLEYGNIYSWCTEPYIENETVGCIAPGMPQTANTLTNRFALTTGEYESVVWARFFGVMFSIAYFENNSVTAMEKASAILPKWSNAKFIYNKALELQQKYPNDWRSAAKELTNSARFIYRLNNECTAYDVNCGFTVLSILYGNNNYYETVKVASLIGYDADCTAAIVGGLMGIIKGMSGTDETIKQIVYNNGNGMLINDGMYVPYIAQGYPTQQKFTDIALLYQRNMEKVLAASNGTILSDKYIIRQEEVKSGCSVDIPNRDFEDELIGVKSEFHNGAQGGIDNIQSFLPHSGNQTARILASQQGATGKVYVQTDNLEIGKYYKVTGYLVAKGENRASLFVSNGSQFLTTSTYNNPTDWYSRSIVFRATEISANIGLYVPPIKAGLFNAYLDDIVIEECQQNVLASYEAESLTVGSELYTVKSCDTINASQNSYISVVKASKIKNLSVVAKENGEHIMRIRFSNNSGVVVTARVMSSLGAQAKFPFYVTGDKTSFEENIIEVPIDLHKGENVLSIEQFSGAVSLDRIEIVSDSSFYVGSDSNMSVIKPVSTTESLVKLTISPNKILIVEQEDVDFSSAAIFSVSGQHCVDFQLSAKSSTCNISNLGSGIFILCLSGKTMRRVLKFINL
jgi:hypothetical protein